MSKRNIVHVEIPATDVKGAGKFYQALFDWKIQEMPEMNYTMWEDGSGSGGGFPAVSEENPAGQVLVYIDSDDIEADLKKVVSNRSRGICARYTEKGAYTVYLAGLLPVFRRNDAIKCILRQNRRPYLAYLAIFPGYLPDMPP